MRNPCTNHCPRRGGHGCCTLPRVIQDARLVGHGSVKSCQLQPPLVVLSLFSDYFNYSVLNAITVFVAVAPTRIYIRSPDIPVCCPSCWFVAKNYLSSNQCCRSFLPRHRHGYLHHHQPGEVRSRVGPEKELARSCRRSHHLRSWCCCLWPQQRLQ